MFAEKNETIPGSFHGISKSAFWDLIKELETMGIYSNSHSHSWFGA